MPSNSLTKITIAQKIKSNKSTMIIFQQMSDSNLSDNRNRSFNNFEARSIFRKRASKTISNLNKKNVQGII
jgi:hypothetical protein